MNSVVFISCLIFYFLSLFTVSKFTSEYSNNRVFFNARKQAKWALVSFGMIGATLSGITFISVPGWVQSTQLSYIQMVFGYLLGYFLITKILLPIYYAYNVTSIYEYLNKRFGKISQLTSSSLFIFSRSITTSLRLFLVLKIAYLVFLNNSKIPFEATSGIIIFGIWLYTKKNGIKTIIYTDVIQTFFMLLSLFVALIILISTLDLSLENFVNWWYTNKYTKIFFFDDFNSSNYFLKQFIGGIFIAFCMTGLDQDLMQKNLSCKNLNESKKNIFVFSFFLLVVIFLFMVLGVFLATFSENNFVVSNGDMLFADIAINYSLGWAIKYSFVLGLIAATVSSTDSSITSITTSFSIDIFKIEKIKNQEKYRKITHIFTCFLIWFIVVFANNFLVNESLIEDFLFFVVYIYGPLLGIYVMGIFTKLKISEKLVPLIFVLSPVLSYFIQYYTKKLIGFDFGYSIIAVNGIISFVLFIMSGFILPLNKCASPSKSTSESSQ